ncbi:MAG TPA: hypothetical protein PK668_26830 [Myxococcota bacterium]|nr:hypothetical protein [Myxococcota bacterium]HRY97144.1 hypothetical protein [Myxococcota bacterium]HSA23606.1 hypothetical protein [Myxococcota bacterium]
MRTHAIGALTSTCALLLAAGQARAAPCPVCPAGCVPLEYVEQLKAPPPGPAARVCPDECAPLEQVKSMREKPGCELQAEQAGPVTPPPAEQRNEVTTRNRVILTPTAFMPPPDQATFTGYAAGLWEFSYTLGEVAQVGTYFTLPVVVFGVFPEARAGVRLGDHVALGGGVLGGLIFGYATDVSGDLFWLIGGHGELSLMFGDHLLNFSLMAFGGGFRWESGNDDLIDGALLLPTFGYRWAFHRNWSLQLELTVPLLVQDGLENDDDVVVLLMYGFRGHGDTMFGDIGFCLPIYEDFIDEVWQYVPLGFPYFSIGFNF